MSGTWRLAWAWAIVCGCAQPRGSSSISGGGVDLAGGWTTDREAVAQLGGGAPDAGAPGDLARASSPPESAVVDQAQLAGLAGEYPLRPAQSVGQSFVAGRDGELTGVEVAIGACAADASTSVELVLSNAEGAWLAAVRIPGAPLPCPAPRELAADEQRGTYFDLSAQAVRVHAGDALSFLLVAHAPPGHCDTAAHQCDEGLLGAFCFIDDECARLGATLPENWSDPYARGAVWGVTPSGRFESPGDDLVFKTFVR